MLAPQLSRPIGDRLPAHPAQGATVGPRPLRSLVEQTAIVLAALLVVLSIVQVCVWIYTRSLLTTAASDAAVTSGHGDVAAVDVTERVADTLGAGIAGNTRESLHCTRITTMKRVEVRCTVDAPGFIGMLNGVLPPITAVDHIARDASAAAAPG